LQTQTKTKILVVDDDRGLRKGIVFALKRKGYKIREAPDGVEAESILRNESFDLVITDLEMPRMKGMELLKVVKTIAPDTITMVISGFGTIEKAVEAMQHGAQDFITKGESFSIDELEVKVDKLLHQKAMKEELKGLRKENLFLRKEIQDKFRVKNFIGKSPAILKVFERVDKVTEDGQVTVLIRGDSGTGKELIAKSIHYNGPRNEAPFITVNCAAIPDTLLESEFFGHEKGAFTDAVKRKIGRFEQADKGSIFLDEIGEISPKLQVKLLRVLQERSFERIGGNETISVDVRVIAATNRDLENELETGAFRQDLYYRLNVVPIVVPPLNERKEDIPLLIDFFMKKFSREKKRNMEINSDVIEALTNYRWPGNVRELENLIEQMIILSSENILDIHNLPSNIKPAFNKLVMPIPEGEKSMKRAKQMIIESFEKKFIQDSLKRNDGNVAKTARDIGISREGLHRKITHYEITADRV